MMKLIQGKVALFPNRMVDYLNFIDCNIVALDISYRI